jgi:hypothetical protein
VSESEPLSKVSARSLPSRLPEPPEPSTCANTGHFTLSAMRAHLLMHVTLPSIHISSTHAGCKT